MPDDPQGGQPQQPTEVQQLAAALQAEFQALRQQQAATQQQLQHLARERAEQANRRPAPTGADFAALRENFHAQWDANPLRSAAELQNGAAEIALQKSRAEFHAELERRDAMQRADQYRQAVLQYNPDIAPRWAQFESYVGWAQQNRPDLNFDGQVQVAIQATRQAAEQEFNDRLRAMTEEQRQRALASMPAGGAFGPGPGQPADLDDAEARSRRYEMLIARTNKAMRGAYRTPPASAVG